MWFSICKLGCRQECVIGNIQLKQLIGHPNVINTKTLHITFSSFWLGHENEAWMIGEESEIRLTDTGNEICEN